MLQSNHISIQPDQRFSLAAEVLFQDFDEKALLLDLSSEKVFQLNQTGAHIVTLLNEGRSYGVILAILKDTYTTSPSELVQEKISPPDQLEQDVNNLLAELLANNLIVKKSP